MKKDLLQQAHDALEGFEQNGRTDKTLSQGDAAIVALRDAISLPAQPAEAFKKLSDEEVLWIAESHGIDVYSCNALAFYADLISTTPTQLDQPNLGAIK